MFLEVLKAEYLNNYRIKLTFNNGKIKTVDLKDELSGSVYEPLRQIDYFKINLVCHKSAHFTG